MANHRRCICGRNVKIGNQPPGKVRTHRMIEVYTEPYSVLGVPEIHSRQRIRFLGLCPASGLTEKEFKKFKVTWKAFHDQK